MKAPALMSELLAALAIFSCACAWLTPSHVVDVATIAGCVLSHSTDTVEQIAVECAIQDQQQIRDILAAHKAAEKREGAECY